MHFDRKTVECFQNGLVPVAAGVDACLFEL